MYLPVSSAQFLVYTLPTEVPSEYDTMPAIYWLNRYKDDSVHAHPWWE